MNNKEIKEKLFSLADEKYRKFTMLLCPNVNNIIGVRMPILKSIAKELSKENTKEYLKNASNKYYEEIIMQGLVIGLTKELTIDETLYYLKKFIPKIDNWAVCDTLCSSLKITKRNMQKMWDFLNSYINSKNEFEVRFSLVMMLNFYITDEYIDKVFMKINMVRNEGYYAKMSLAWLISLLYIKYRKETVEFLNNNNLDKFTYNKAIQKIIESNRISKEEKDKVREMKR